MSDTYSEDDRKPAAVEDREPRDREKGKGGGGVKLPPSARSPNKGPHKQSDEHDQKHSHKQKQHHHDKSCQNNRNTNDGDDEKIAANDVPEMDNKHKRSHKQSHKHSDKHKRHHHDKPTREAHEKVAADDFARAPATDKKWNTFSSLDVITESIKPPYKYSNEEGYKKEMDEDKIAKLSEPLTYAPSLMAHVYHHDAAATNSRNEIEKEKAAVDASTRNNRDSIGFQTGMEATMEPFAGISAHQEDQLIGNKLEEGTFGANFEPAFDHDGTNNIPAASIPRPLPPRETQPGAIRVGGIDEENADDDDNENIVTGLTIESGIADPNNPVLAEVVDEDEENQRIQEKVEREWERQRAEQEGEIPEAEIVIEKQNCTIQVKIWSGVVVVLLVTVAVVSGMVLPQKTPSPQEILKELESLLIPVSFDNGTALHNQSTPQNEALNWLASNVDLDSYSNATKIQRYALATLFYSTNGNSWYGKDEWMSNSNECHWYNSGSSVCTNGSVDTIDLWYNNLVGTIPNELALMSNLYKSWLKGNSLMGTIPSQLGSLTKLTLLSLSENNLIGTIPSQLGLLSKLTSYLDLSENSLTGMIPSEVGLLTKLNELHLYNNNLTGTIPSEVGLLTKLTWLYLYDNNLTGTIPSQIALLSNLSVLDLSSNKLTGMIPSEIAMMSNLSYLYLYNNNFTGEFTCPVDFIYLYGCLISCDDYNNNTCQSV